MQRAKQVAALWNWIPAFRAVAETEHLPTASEKLSVSAPALSRTIRLLEGELGTELFRRTGRRLELNDAGRAFLVSVRAAMQQVYDGMQSARGGKLGGPVYVASDDFVATSHMTRVLERLRQDHPDMHPWVVSVPHYCVVQELLRGELDVALQAVAPTSDDVAVTRLGEEPNRVYCGPTHPLYEQRGVTMEAVLDHDFVFTPADRIEWSGPVADLGPRRRFAARVEKTSLALDLCHGGRHLAVLPESVVRHAPVSLHPLPVGVVSHTPILAVHRVAVDPGGRVDVVLRTVASELRRDPPSPLSMVGS